MNLVVPVTKRNNFLSILLILVFIPSTFAQEAEPASNVSAETAPAAAEPATEDEKYKRKNTYLDIFHAKTSASNLKGKLLVDIHRLRVMVYNYGDSDEKASYDKIKDS